MKKILFIIPTITQTNGVAAFIINYLSHMDLSRLRIDIIYDNLRPSPKYEETLKRLNVVTFKLPYIKEIGLLKYRKKVIDFFKEHHDYDLIYSNISYKSILYFQEAKKYGIKKLAIHAHATQSSDNIIKNMIGRYVQKIVNKMVSHRFACSKLAGQEMFNTDKFEIVNNAIDYSKYAFNEKYRNKIRKELKINDEIKIIGFVGRFVHQKNIFFFIKLAEKLTDQYKILMIGQGVQKQDFISKIKELKIENKFILIDEITNVNEYYSAFDYFLLPSIYEGLPIVGVEAQANGLPCLFSDTISDECKISNNVVYLNNDDIKLWIKNIKKMSRNNKIKLNSDFNIILQGKELEKKISRIIEE